MIRKTPKILLHAVRQRTARDGETMLRVVPVPLLVNLDALAHPASYTARVPTAIRDRAEGAHRARPGLPLAPERSVRLMRTIPAPRKALRHPRLGRIVLVDRIRLGVHTHIRRRRCSDDVPDIRTRKLGIKVVGRLVRLDDGFERRRELLEREGRPVDVVEKRMFFEFGGAALRSETVFRITVEEL